MPTRVGLRVREKPGKGVANLASLLALGFFLGMGHATDADHGIAIATIVSRQRTLRGSALIGAAWGVEPHAPTPGRTGPTHGYFARLPALVVAANGPLG